MIIKKINTLLEKVRLIKNNVNTYQQNAYNGKNNIYDMNGIQIKLNNCVNVFESEEYQNLANKENVEIKDVYKLGKFYQKAFYNINTEWARVSNLLTDFVINYNNNL